MNSTPTKYPSKAFIIDSVHQTISQMNNPNVQALITEIVGIDAEQYNLDNHDNFVYVSDTNTNSRYAYYFEGMISELEEKRYSQGVGRLPWAESMGRGHDFRLSALV